MKEIFLIVIIFLTATRFSFAQTKESKPEKEHFIYLLRLEKAMLDSAAWTPEKSQIVENHFTYLKRMLADGKLILAGRTQVSDDKTCGIVVYEANSFVEAKKIADEDPAVIAKVMTVEVFPFSIALIQGGKSE